MPELNSKPFLDMALPLNFAEISEVLANYGKVDGGSSKRATGEFGVQADDVVVELTEILDQTFRFLSEMSLRDVRPTSVKYDLDRIDLESARTLNEVYNITELELIMSYTPHVSIAILGKFICNGADVNYMGIRLINDSPMPQQCG